MPDTRQEPDYEVWAFVDGATTPTLVKTGLTLAQARQLAAEDRYVRFVHLASCPPVEEQ